MSFLRRAANDEEPDVSGTVEEVYERLFAKIGRDFIYKKDFYRIIQEILSIVDPKGIRSVDFRDDSEARQKAFEYKAVLDSGVNGSVLYKDLVDLDED